MVSSLGGCWDLITLNTLLGQTLGLGGITLWRAVNMLAEGPGWWRSFEVSIRVAAYLSNDRRTWASGLRVWKAGWGPGHALPRSAVHVWVGASRTSLLPSPLWGASWSPVLIVFPARFSSFYFENSKPMEKFKEDNEYPSLRLTFALSFSVNVHIILFFYFCWIIWE